MMEKSIKYYSNKYFRPKNCGDTTDVIYKTFIENILYKNFVRFDFFFYAKRCAIFRHGS